MEAKQGSSATELELSITPNRSLLGQYSALEAKHLFGIASGPQLLGLVITLLDLNKGGMLQIGAQ